MRIVRYDCITVLCVVVYESNLQSVFIDCYLSFRTLNYCLHFRHCEALAFALRVVVLQIYSNLSSLASDFF